MIDPNWQFILTLQTKLTHRASQTNYGEEPVFKRNISRGTWVAQSLSINFGSGHDLTVDGFEPRVTPPQSLEPVWDSVSASLSPSPLLMLSLSVSQK